MPAGTAPPVRPEVVSMTGQALYMYTPVHAGLIEASSRRRRAPRRDRVGPVPRG
ncbi:hypothetical protein Cus16_1313 [Curtobacterium sp. ER1/6]|nr:hypothetical protein Cus16_1313 [Curtobacterium sp. ER1/6]